MDRFTGGQIGAFVELLAKDFDPNTFDQFLLARLNRSRPNLTLKDDFIGRLFDVVLRANQELWHLDLLNAAVAARRADQELGRFAEPFIETSANAANLEALTNDAPFWDSAELRARMAEIENHVCRVETAETKGSGFLVAPDLVLTNYHVVWRLVQDKAKAGETVCRFDYKKLGGSINPGTEVGLDAAKPVLSYRKYAMLDTKNTALSSAWGENELDYALLKLSKAVGKEPPGPLSGQHPTDPNDKPRGWERWSKAPIAKGEPLFIWQHPKGDPIKFSSGKLLDPCLNNGSTRVRYSNNTLAGSSGSPCFDSRLRWLALHHAGDPDWKEGHLDAEYNQGIPAARIAAACEADGVTLS
jgi:hypothetical protein